MENESSNKFEVQTCYPTLNPMLDDIERKILAPLSHLREFGTEWVLEVDLPMVEKDDIIVTLDGDDTITIEARLRETYCDTNLDYNYEFDYFKKTIRLPGKIDEKKILAKFENGRLVIRIPKLRSGNKIRIE